MLAVVEEIRNTTKQTYYEYFEDFKRCANILVSHQMLSKFYECVKSGEGSPFVNSVAYLEMVLRRINTER